MKRAAGVVVVCLVLAWLGLLVTEKGVLVGQRLVRPGEHYVVAGWGDLGTREQSQLACSYFVGTRIRQQVFWYEPSGFMGRADCPFIVDR